MIKQCIKLLVLSLLLFTFGTMVFPSSTWASTTWFTEQADNKSMAYPGGLGYDANENPGILQMDFNNEKVVYRYKSSAGNWVSEEIASSIYGNTSLAYDNNGSPVALYLNKDVTPNIISYATRSSDGSWSSQQVASGTNIPYNISLAVNSSGQPAFAYVDGDSLYFVTKSGASWSKQKVTTVDYSYNASLDFNGLTPCLAFSDKSNGLRYAYKSGSSWTIQTVNPSTSIGDITLKFGNGKPLISYSDRGNKDLCFAYYLNGWTHTVLERSTATNNYVGDYAVMNVHQQEGAYEIYLLHGNTVMLNNTQVKLKTLSVAADSDLTSLGFQSQTLYSGYFGNTTPMFALGLNQGNPGIMFLKLGTGSTYIAQKPKIQVVTSLSFGDIPSNSSVERQISITNTGSLPLNVAASIPITDTSFEVTSGTVPTLSPGESYTLTVNFEPGTPGTNYTSTLSLTSNDPDRPTVGVSLTGRSYSNNSSLDYLELSNGNTVTSFVDNAGSLEVPYATESLHISPVASDSHTSITINGTTVSHQGLSPLISLHIGENIITISLTSEDGTSTNTYTFTITRRDSPEAHLSSLTVSTGTLTPEFSPQITRYSISLPDGIYDYSIAATTVHTSASITVDGTDAVLETTTVSATGDVGENIHRFHVVAPDNDTTIDYEVSVYRLPELSGIALDYGSITPAFEPYLTAYSTYVPSSTTTLTITPATIGVYSSGTYSVNGVSLDDSGVASVPLHIGDNTITIGAISSDGKAIRTYTLTVDRLEPITGMQMGKWPVWSSGEDYDPQVDIYQEEATLFYDLPEDMWVTVNGTLMAEGEFYTSSFVEGVNRPIRMEFFSPLCSEPAIYELTVIRQPILTELKINNHQILLSPEDPNSWPSVPSTSTSAIIEVSVNSGTTIRAEGNYTFTPITTYTNAYRWRIDNLHMGYNYINLEMLSPDGRASRTHMIYLQRLSALDNLTISSDTQPNIPLTPNFQSHIYEYSVQVPSIVDTVSLTGTVPSEPAIHLTINDVPCVSEVPTSPIDLSYGNNYIYLELLLDWVYTRTDYMVNVIREEPTAITISDSTPGVSSRNPATNTTYTADTTGTGKVPVTMDESTGVASVNLSRLATSLKDGQNIIVNVPALTEAQGYTATIPSSSLSDALGGSITMNTQLGSLTLPGNMLSDGDPTGTVGVSVQGGNKESLPDAVRTAIGDRPLIQLTLSVDGNPVSWNNPEAPVTVRVPYTPTEEEQNHPENIVIWYIDGKGNPVCVPNGRYNKDTGMVTFDTTHFSHYAVLYHSLSFLDVPETAWYAPAVSFLSAREITTGTSETLFSPLMKLTRGQFLVLLMKTYEIPPDNNSTINFADAGDTYYTGYLAAAKEMGIARGIGNNQFAPTREISRQEMFTLLFNTLEGLNKLPKFTSPQILEDYMDHEDILPWAREPMSQLVKAGIIKGSNHTLTPLHSTTRAEMAQVLKNLLWE